MDILLAAWILFWDIIIVTVTVSITHYKLKQAERIALKERDAIEAKFLSQAQEMRNAIVERIDAIEIPEPDIESIKDELKESLAQSLNAHITGIKKELNNLKESLDKAVVQQQSGHEGVMSPLDRMIPKFIEKYL